MGADLAKKSEPLARVLAVLQPVAIARRRAATVFRSGWGEIFYFQVQLPDLTVKRLNEFSNRCRYVDVEGRGSPP
jgi:hypothetical protein